MRRLIPYLVLNFIVSALAVMIVLWLWDATHKPPENSLSLNEGYFPGVVATDRTPTPQPSGAVTFEIKSVIGAGDINFEKVQLLNISENPINLFGWTLGINQEPRLTFPAITVYPNGGVSVYSKSGMNTSIELFGNFTDAIWKSGSAVNLRDGNGNVRATYLVP